MLDVRRFRHESDQVKQGLARRGSPELLSLIDEVRALDEARRAALAEANELKARRNEVSKEVGERKRSGVDATELILAMRVTGERIAELDDSVRSKEARVEEILLIMPNLPLVHVPDGGADANAVLHAWGAPPQFAFTPRPHWEIGGALGILDLERGTKLSGTGFPVLRGQGARVQRALIDWFLDVHTSEHGYVELRVPYLVTRDTLVGTGQLPKFADELYQTERDDLWLIPTAEVPVTNLHRDELLSVKQLPLKYVSYTPCFRREAGAAGKDTRGLLRVHQFDKVELVRYERPEKSEAGLEELTRHAETLLERLGLHYRRVAIATGDLGFHSAMTYDLEVWSPGVEKWLEVSSCSTFTDFQARRASLRFRPSPADKPEFVHTLNGSGLALPRVMAALLETYQRADGSVAIPEVLRERIGFDHISVNA
jgi:seryl-tRNA synthetase